MPEGSEADGLACHGTSMVLWYANGYSGNARNLLDKQHGGLGVSRRRTHIPNSVPSQAHRHPMGQCHETYMWARMRACLYACMCARARVVHAYMARTHVNLCRVCLRICVHVCVRACACVSARACPRARVRCVRVHTVCVTSVRTSRRTATFPPGAAAPHCANTQTNAQADHEHSARTRDR